MKHIKIIIFLFLFIFSFLYAYSSPMYSPTWGFALDLPEDYEYIEGDGRDRFSFITADGAHLDIVVYPQGSVYSSVEEMAMDTQERLGSYGDTSFFEYRNKDAVILELIFPRPDDPFAGMVGWGIAVELDADNPEEKGPLLLALAYSPHERSDLWVLHLSVLDSFIPGEAYRRYPGPITEFSYPRDTRTRRPVWGLNEEAWFYDIDEMAAQDFIEREFNVFLRYADSPFWQDAWTRYYRAIYRDSFERLKDAAFVIERHMNSNSSDNTELASRVLEWIQKFQYERRTTNSDFLNLVSAAIEGRGDCDSRAMLWALVLNQANIPATMMISRHFSHAMGLADLPGIGARFEYMGIEWLVAETTENVSICLIAEDVSDVDGWIGIILDRTIYQ